MRNHCGFTGHLRRAAALGKPKNGQPFSAGEFAISGLETPITCFAFGELAVLLTQLSTDVEAAVVGWLMRNKRTNEVVIKFHELSKVLTPSQGACTSLEQGGAA